MPGRTFRDLLLSFARRAVSVASATVAVVTVFSVACSNDGHYDTTVAPESVARFSETDVTAPAQVTDVTITGDFVSSFTLSWTAVGDDGFTGTATAYQLRRSNAPISEASWAGAQIITGAGLLVPSQAGFTENLTISDVDRSVDNHYALKVIDDAGNQSMVSNDVLLPALDPVRPARVTDFAIDSVTSGYISVSWTAVGDDGVMGFATSYELRRANHAITDANWSSAETVPVPFLPPSAPGSRETVLVFRGDRSRRSYWAICALDEIGNRSPVSNNISLLTWHESGRTRTE